MDGKITKGFNSVEAYSQWCAYVGLKDCGNSYSDLFYFAQALNERTYNRMKAKIKHEPL